MFLSSVCWSVPRHADRVRRPPRLSSQWPALNIRQIAACCGMWLLYPTLSALFKEGIQADDLPNEPTGAFFFFCFVWGFVCFLFWLSFLMIKAAFDMSAALNDGIFCSSLATSLCIPASFCYACASSYLTTVSLFSKLLLALCQHPSSADSPKVQLSASCFFPFLLLV